MRLAPLLAALLAALAVQPAPAQTGAGGERPGQAASGEAAQTEAGARAMTQFLRRRVVDRAGVVLPRPSPRELAAFGPRAQDWAILAEFHDAVVRQVVPGLRDAGRRGAPTSVAAMLERRADLVTMRDRLAVAMAALRDAQDRAASARAALAPQPPTLAAAFDAAYAGDVGRLAGALEEVLRTGEAAAASALALVDYVAAHPGGVQVAGSSLQASDAALGVELARLAAASGAASRAAHAARDRSAPLLRALDAEARQAQPAGQAARR